MRKMGADLGTGRISWAEDGLKSLINWEILGN